MSEPKLRSVCAADVAICAPPRRKRKHHTVSAKYLFGAHQGTRGDRGGARKGFKVAREESWPSGHLTI
jgi:hypothetical protein